jgi:hypothetical protein
MADTGTWWKALKRNEASVCGVHSLATRGIYNYWLWRRKEVLTLAIDVEVMTSTSGINKEGGWVRRCEGRRGGVYFWVDVC